MTEAEPCMPGGRLHVVDFGDQERLPGIARALLLRWLAMFDVTPRDDLKTVLSAMAESHGADLSFERPFRGYAQYAVLTLPAEPSRPRAAGWHSSRQDCSRSRGPSA